MPVPEFLAISNQLQDPASWFRFQVVVVTVMAAVPAQSLRVSEIKDLAALFERYSTDEIRGVERKVRGEIEQKKEELRQMVGERYRDLIEAADTIREMSQCSESVVQSVQDMYRYCHKLKQNKTGPVAANKVESQRPSQEKFYSMAAQIKLLLEIPEWIWSSMESAQYLRATQLYLLCCHLHSLLQLESSGSHYSPVLSRFPILVRQVAASGHFRSTILLESKSLLKGRAVSDQAIAEALASIMLLEDSSPRQVLADFLLARKASIQQLLNQPHHGSGIKAQVCSLVELLATTLYQAYAVFYTPLEGQLPDPALSSGLLFTTLETGTAPAGKGVKVLNNEMKSGSWFKYLPSSVTDFQPVLRTLARPINQDHLRDTLLQWINMCKEDIKSGISSLLVYVKSLKGLAAIRDAVWELLTSESLSQHWGFVCQRLLEHPLSFWEDFLQQLFLDRLQALTKEGLDGISSSSKQLLVSALQELAARPAPGGQGRAVQFEYDIASFLWSEAPSDLLSDAAWVSVSNRSHLLKSGLSMKAQALTPCIQSFCGSLDSKLKIKLDDLLSYLPPEKNLKDSADPPTGSQLRNSAFDRYADASTVEESLREHCLSCVRYILSCVQSELKAAQDRLQSSSRYSPLDSNLNSVLFMARLCQSMGELCPNLKQCIMGKAGDHVTRETTRIGKKLGKGSSKAPEVNPAQARWQEVREELLKHSMEAYRIWSITVSKALVHRFTLTLHSDTAGSILATATNWEELEIQEETETGNSVTSKIRLPVQPSWYVQSLLFHLCQEVNRVGGHALPKVTQQELLKGFLDELIPAYNELASNKHNKQDSAFPMTQNRSLQLLFDLRYLTMVLSARQEEGKTPRTQQDPRIQQVIEALESHIDPFDLDVFTPPLNSNLHRLSQRTSVLLGLLTGTEKMFTSRSTNVNSQEPYNILPLSSSQIRFGLLPLSMSSSQRAKSATRGSEVKKSQRSPVSAPRVEETFRPGNLFRQLASQEEEPAAPSLFKMGWLSSMTK
ncbi:conserved oligomeric Golgi complex subunit 1-like isoform X3 [Acipenser ruthenus]|uniref:conserved oligomeric Golgi complex subunit 1-like isoform X3 n=1 Tax=Acipenser ruthenus TaxID=7906 RepID=UPI00145BF9D3|nr:conserved oligomeric Golgi complex subunit 1-like isoform X3 [Acipenser ruthenus]